MFPMGNLFDIPEVKRGLTSKTSRLEQAIDLYSPDDYPPNVVSNNKDTWIGKVEQKFFDIVDFADGLKEKDSVTEEDIKKINDWVKKARTNFQKYVIDVDARCNITGAGAITGAAFNANNSDESAVSVNTECRKIAEVEVKIHSERISDCVKTLKAEIKKFDDWSKVESHEKSLRRL